MAIPAVLVQQYWPAGPLIVLSEAIPFLDSVVNEAIKKISPQIRLNLGNSGGGGRLRPLRKITRNHK